MRSKPLRYDAFFRAQGLLHRCLVSLLGTVCSCLARLSSLPSVMPKDGVGIVTKALMWTLWHLLCC